MRRTIPLVIGAFVGSLMVLEYFLRVPVLTQMAESIRTWVVIVATFALGLGAVNLFIVHKRSIDRRSPNWINSIVLIAAMLITVVLGIARGTGDPAYQFIFNAILTACGTAMFALLAFFIASASSRSFRIRNWDAGLLLCAATLVMLGKVPIGEAISNFFPAANQWIMDVPNVAGQRGIMICSGLGFIAVCFRIIAGYTRDHLGGGS